jgi:alpha-mannosidase
MTFTELAVLLPCHSLEDFPVYHEGSAADELLAAWCALWHPALVADVQAVPTWHRIDMPPDELSGRLMTVPPFCEDRLPAGFVARCESDGARLVREPSRDAAVAAALESLGGKPKVDPDLSADFLALGFCRLQMELLTRQMRYSPNIDETYFQIEALAAANAAVAGETQTARDHLLQCFDTLHESRKHFYPVDVHLLDVTLLAETTLGPSLDAELAAETPINILATTALLQELARNHPETWSKLLAAIDAETAYVLGGERQERELPLLPLETALASLREGNDDYNALLGRRPMVYGRRRAGLWPGLVQLLTKLGYQGALHFTLDDGRFPLGPQAKSRWEGTDMSVLDMFARVPADAAKPETFLSLARALSDSMDNDHVATVALAHWPSAASPWYDVLRRTCRLSPVLGKFTRLDDYFMHTDMPGQLSKFEADEYRTPYLKQAVIRRQTDPISSFVRAHRQQAERTALSALHTVCDLITDSAEAASDQDLPPQLDDVLPRLANALPRQNAPASHRALIFNAAPFSRRIGVELSPWEHAPPVEGPVVAAGTSGKRHFAVVDVPSLGFAWIEPAAASAAGSRDKPIANEYTLANELFELKISRATGGIASLYNYRQRRNQLSQQIAFRTSGSSADAGYTTMRAESVEVTASCPAYGEIVSSGALLDAAGRPMAKFRQTTGAWAGSPLIHVAIELSDVEEPRADPWNSYYAARFAWHDENAQLWRGVSSARQKTRAGRLEAPEFIDVDNGSATVTILTGGLPYHRRSDPRMLDSLLVVRGETARRFELGIGVDLPHPAAAALDLITPRAVHFETASPAMNVTGWFFHAGAKNVVATDWRPMIEPADDAATTTARRTVSGFAARLLEIGGQAGRVPLRTFRRVARARQVDFLGETILELSVDDDKIMLDFGAHEFIELEARWAP